MGAAPGAGEGESPVARCPLSTWGICRFPQSPAPDTEVAPALLPERA